MILGVTFALTRSDKAMAIVMLPVLVAMLLLAHTGWELLAFVAVAAGHIWIVQLAAVRRQIALSHVPPMQGETHV